MIFYNLFDKKPQEEYRIFPMLKFVREAFLLEKANQAEFGIHRKFYQVSR